MPGFRLASSTISISWRFCSAVKRRRDRSPTSPAVSLFFRACNSTESRLPSFPGLASCSRVALLLVLLGLRKDLRRCFEQSITPIVILSKQMPCHGRPQRSSYRPRMPWKYDLSSSLGVRRFRVCSPDSLLNNVSRIHTKTPSFTLPSAVDLRTTT